MLLFRSEEHVRRWCRSCKRKPGAIFSLQQGWRLAQAWYADRLDPGATRSVSHSVTLV